MQLVSGEVVFNIPLAAQEALALQGHFIDLEAKQQE